ncbi:MAG: tetratricopeptide repeat protein [Gammaproteobacteria bacterium]|nr:tetratricopeptide repeat protein [Gammaproteobacteria bacterium]NNF61908.1 tetratricopeptide repeat protein [Gammaproteobacteria bacterium]NNM19788.1 tetratricopeptide repeat protein [Gammaproteobacteria bacterium]
MTADTIFLAVLFVLAAAGGWLAARLTSRPRRGKTKQTVPPAEIYRGLNHILHDETDRALTLLKNLAQSDSATAEVHFALGTLFRQRGETDRAIKVHQNLLARPDLARRHREQALFALAEDYLKAGLYDRAEALFLQLVEQEVRLERSLQLLVGIYERQQDWEQAVQWRRRLARLTQAPQNEIIAHYYCELAQQARDDNDLAGMRAALKKAQQSSRGTVRGALMRADLASLTDDLKTAMRLYRRVLESAPEFAAVVLRRLHGCHKPDAPELSRTLQMALKRQPELAGHLAHAALATGLGENSVVAETTAQFIKDHRALADLSSHYEGSHTEVTALLRSLGLAHLHYRCGQCGYLAAELNWQCPACQSWGSARPEIALTA